MAKLKFLGATGTVTGSRYLLEIEGLRLLIDCGVFQGSKENRLRNWERFPVPPKSINGVLLTHAHIDHAGYIPRLVREGFIGKIHCTRPTADLCAIMLKDSAHIQEEDAAFANKKGFSKHAPAQPLYTVLDAEKSLRRFEAVHYGEQLDLTDNLRVKFKDAGHILGSAMIDLRTANGKRRRKIVFGGDLGRPHRELLRDPSQIYDIDYLVLESTYGDRLHGDQDFHREFVRVVNEAMKRGGVLVIPAFSVGRTQTLLYILRRLKEHREIPDMPIYVDSPMAIDALEVYRKRIDIQNLMVRTQTIAGEDIFEPRGLILCDTRDQSQQINDVKGGAIIISSSGMATGGRILHHLALRLPDPKNTVLFIGYQAEGTRGRSILEGEKTVKIHGRHVDVRAHIENLSGFSGHADYNETLAWLMGFDRAPEKVFIVHGEPESSQSLADKIRKHYGWDVVIPEFGQEFELEM